MLAQRYETIADELAQADDAGALFLVISKFLQAEGICSLPFPTEATIVPHQSTIEKQETTGGNSKDPNMSSSVFIAYDTRESGPELAAAAAAGAGCFGVPVRILGRLTTPQLHWTVMRVNQGLLSTEEDYLELLASSFLRIVGAPEAMETLYVDCANGVGGEKLAALAPRIRSAGLQLEVRNTGKGILNHVCGSDYVQKERKLPENFGDLPPGSRCCSIDGDADRLVYFYPAEASAKQQELVLLDGDKIAALAAELVQGLVAKLPGRLKESHVGVVQTAYANGSSTDFLVNKVGCDVMVTPTGVKHLHEAAKSYDVGVYFESNGHGTVIFKESFLGSLQGVAGESKAAQELIALNGVINAAVGDAISGILLVEVALKWRQWNLKQWSDMYSDLPSQQRKVVVPDRTAITTTNAERTVTKPDGLQQAIDEIVKEYSSGRSFVRPSGTEDVVRVYAEAATQESAVALAEQVATQVTRFLGSVE